MPGHAAALGPNTQVTRIRIELPGRMKAGSPGGPMTTIQAAIMVAIFLPTAEVIRCKKRRECVIERYHMRKVVSPMNFL